MLEFGAGRITVAVGSDQRRKRRGRYCVCTRGRIDQSHNFQSTRAVSRTIEKVTVGAIDLHVPIALWLQLDLE